MTRRDFQLIADALTRARHILRDTERTTPNTVLRVTAEALADALATTNPRFDRARFVAACAGQE